ncbi:DUF2809 domain-containing protein [Mucilaginibacter jinjuensis]|uniref:DUF2809 domain-containing protein n=1 Tax=Mucilaginibacter jinjuensis TaxID=1176721 RepID=A0ABY7T735_9SPHI|nr:DUF2809 domain-containing protein [Mucilaginibacter jinjuensis]WCT11047.1 DUF2809 domain-containing protein [Mucilaginibacter jinjuensis]
MFKFNPAYFILAVVLFLVEFFIGFYMHDAIIRPFGGDFLVVILLYCMVKSVADTRVAVTAIGVLLFSYVVETLQYFHIVNILGLQNSRVTCIIIGTGFSWIDMLMYTLGILLVWLIEVKILRKPK